MIIQDLFMHQENWCKDYMAKNTHGQWTKPDSETAICWCLLGAYRKCYPDDPGASVLRRISDTLIRLFPKRLYTLFPGYAEMHTNMHAFNDKFSTTITDVRLVVKEANV